jgi:mono/diheme cytochrome c family protein
MKRPRRRVIMGRRWKLAIAALLVGVSVSGGDRVRLVRAEERASATAATTTQKKLSRKQQQLASAKVLFIENCARCHGADGRGETPMGKVFAATNLADAGWWKRERVSDKRLAASIRDGRKQMPAFGKKLSKEEINALVALVKTFNGK